MEPAHHLGVFTRHWRLLVGCFLAALALGWVLTPSRSGPAVDAWDSTLTVVPAPGSGDIVKLDVVKALATSEQVTASAAKRLRRTDLAELEARVKIDSDAEAGVLTITATGPTQQESEAVAGAFGKAVVDGYRSNLRRSARASADEHRKQLKSLGDQITEVQGAVDTAIGAKRTQLGSQLDALNTQYSELYSTITQLDQTAGTPVLEPFGGIDSTSGDESVLSAPDSRAARLALAAGLGLALGLVAALMLDRLDTRVRGRAQAEEAFGFPVIGEVPVMPRRLRNAGSPAVTARPGTRAAEAYRSLRAALLLTAPPSLSFPIDGRVEERGKVAARRLPQSAPVVLVISARHGDGRTTTVANLAAALAETGRSVLVLDCDFRSPRAHELLGAAPGPGMAELLSGEGEGAPRIEDVVRATSVERVTLITAGGNAGYPAALVVRADEVLDRARKCADVVLVDSSPLFNANDAYDLVSHADTVLLTARSGSVTPEQAGRVSELLARTGVPVAGIALTASPGSPGGAGWAVRRAFDPAAPPAVTPLPSLGGALPRHARDGTEHASPSWARGRDGRSPRAEGDDL